MMRKGRETGRGRKQGMGRGAKMRDAGQARLAVGTPFSTHPQEDPLAKICH